MATIRLDMSVSLDGFVAGPDDGPDHPMGRGGFRLFNWLDRRDEPGTDAGTVYAESVATRALIAGRRTYELAGHWQGDHHHGVPIIVLTHQIPEGRPPGSVRFVTDAAEAAAQARAAAGDDDVLVAGAGAGQALLRVDEVDELELHVVPVLLGQGRRLFDHLPARPVQLELVRRLTGPADEEHALRATHLRYRITRA